MSHYVLGDGGLGDLDAEFQQLAVNARCIPARVVAAHHPNQIPNFLRHPGPTWLATVDFPYPEQTESFPVPGGKCDRALIAIYRGFHPLKNPLRIRRNPLEPVLNAQL
jgi:hypothetical protein